MSYILDALKKAERERELGAVPNLDTTHDSGAPQRRRDGLWLAGAGLALAVVLWFLPWGSDEQPSPAKPGVIETPDRVVADPMKDRAHQTPAVQEPLRRPVAQAPKSTEPLEGGKLQEAAPIRKTQPVRSLTSLVSVTKPAVPQKPVTPAKGKSRAGPAAPPSPAESDKVATEPEAETVDEAEVPPILYEMSSAYQRSVPPLHIDVHVYSQSAKKRFVIINGKKYHEGEAMESGAVLEAITFGGIVVAFQDKRFRLLH